MLQQFSSNLLRLIVLILTFALLFGCSTESTTQTVEPTTLATKQQETPSLDIPTKTYVNSKYSFTFSYPSMLARKKTYLEDDGMYFVDGEASLLVWGSSASPSMFVGALSSNAEEKVAVHDSYSVQTFDRNDVRYCTGSRQTKGALVQFEFKYPIDMSETYEPLADFLIEQISE